MSNDPDFVRHTIPLIFDVPVALANKGAPATDALNLITNQIMDLIEQDKRTQALLARHGIEWGWGMGTWEEGT